MKFECKECGKVYKQRKRYRIHLKKHEFERVVERRRAMGKVCGSCKYHSSNTEFKLYGGKPIEENTCLVSGRKRVGMKAIKAMPDSGCVLAFSMFRSLTVGTTLDRIQKRRKPRRVKSCPYCGKQIGFEFGNYQYHVNSCKRKAEEAKKK